MKNDNLRKLEEASRKAAADKLKAERLAKKAADQLKFSAGNSARKVKGGFFRHN